MWAGSTNKFLNKAPLIRYEFALPPLGEQLEFAYLLKASESTKEVLENAYACALAVRDRLRLQAGIAAAKTVKLAEWIVFLTSGSRGWAKYYSEAGDTFLRLGNLNSSTIDLNLADIQHVQPQNDGEGERTIVQPDDVLLGITGEAGVGLVAIARDCDDRQFISQHIALIRLDKTKASGDFVAHVLAGPFGQRQIWSHNQPSAKAGMTLIAVKEILMPCLSLEEQKDWAWKTNQAEAAMIDIEKRLSKCKKLSRILREACTANDWVE
jgi:type I restriction enzyme S subunit